MSEVDLSVIATETWRQVVRRAIQESCHWTDLALDAIEAPVKVLVREDTEAPPEVRLLERWARLLVHLRREMDEATR